MPNKLVTEPGFATLPYSLYSFGKTIPAFILFFRYAYRISYLQVMSPSLIICPSPNPIVSPKAKNLGRNIRSSVVPRNEYPFYDSDIVKAYRYRILIGPALNGRF